MMTSIEELEGKIAMLEMQVNRMKLERDAAENDLDEMITRLNAVIESAAFKSDINDLLALLQRLGKLDDIDLSRLNL